MPDDRRAPARAEAGGGGQADGAGGGPSSFVDMELYDAFEKLGRTASGVR